MVQDGAGGGATSNFNLKIWEDTGGLQPGALLLDRQVSLVAQNSWNDIDISADNIIVSSGSVRVGLEFHTDPPPSFCRDGDGNIQYHRNLIKAVPGGWFWSEFFGLQGDWILRLQIDGNYGAQTATPAPTRTPTKTPTMPGPTATFTPTQPGPTATFTPTMPGVTYTPTWMPTTTITPTQSTSEGTIEWDAGQYFGLDAHARITVTDPDLDIDPGAQQQLDVRVWSESDPYPSGINVTLYETGLSSDTFQSVYPHVSFSETAGDDDEDMIFVEDGDLVYARYIDENPVGERIASAQWFASQGITLELVMPDDRFGDGELCYLNMNFTNSGDTQEVDLYALLNVFGDYFCYPSWQNINLGLDHDDMFVPADYQGTLELIEEFAMPPVDPVGPLFFHAAMFQDGQLTLETLAADPDSFEFYLE